MPTHCKVLMTSLCVACALLLGYAHFSGQVEAGPSPNAARIQGAGPTGSEGYPVGVVGTVTATPSGTQDVNVVSPVTGGMVDVNSAQSGTWTVQQGTPPWAVSVANGADVTQGATGDTAASDGGTGTVSAKLRGISGDVGSIQSAVNSSFSALEVTGPTNWGQAPGSVTRPVWIGGQCFDSQPSPEADGDIVRAVLNTRGYLGVLPGFELDNGQVTSTGAGSITNLTPMCADTWSIQVEGNGGVPTAWSVDLQVRLSNIAGWHTIITHTNVDGNSTLKSVSGIPATAMRWDVTALTLGGASNLEISILAK